MLGECGNVRLDWVWPSSRARTEVVVSRRLLDFVFRERLDLPLSFNGQTTALCFTPTRTKSSPTARSPRLNRLPRSGTTLTVNRSADRGLTVEVVTFRGWLGASPAVSPRKTRIRAAMMTRTSLFTRTRGLGSVRVGTISEAGVSRPSSLLETIRAVDKGYLRLPTSRPNPSLVAKTRDRPVRRSPEVREGGLRVNWVTTPRELVRTG
jgi:hypothetical protein